MKLSEPNKNTGKAAACREIEKRLKVGQRWVPLNRYVAPRLITALAVNSVSYETFADGRSIPRIGHLTVPNFALWVFQSRAELREETPE